jgi:hypothetical protein
MAAVGALAAFTDIDGWVVGLPVVVAALSVIAVAFLPVHEPPPGPGHPRPAPPLPGRDGGVSGTPPLPGRVAGPDQAAPWWERTAQPRSGAGAGGRSATTARAADPPRWAQPPPDPASSAASAPGAGRAAPAAGPAPPPVSVAIPVPGTPWWEAATTGPAGAQSATPARDERGAAAAGLVGEAAETAVTRVVQCPRCGDFGVDVRQRAPGFSFACSRCGHQWRWEPGSAWPTTVVRPRRKRQQAPAGPTRPDSRR